MEESFSDSTFSDNVTQIENVPAEQMVPLKQYEVLLRLLEDEKILHVKTKTELRETQEKLDFALGELEVLKGQLAREKRQFENAFGIIKKKALSESSKNVELENKCNAIERTAETTGDELRSKQVELQHLAEKLQQQQLQHQQHVMEDKLQRQQDAYISKLVQSNNPKSTKLQTKPPRIAEDNLYQMQQEYIHRISTQSKPKSDKS